MQYIIRQFASDENGDTLILRPIYIEAESDSHAVVIANDTKLDREAVSAYLCRPDDIQTPLLHLENYLLATQAARFMRKSPDTIRRWSYKGIIKPAGRVGNCHLYHRSDLIDLKRGEGAIHLRNRQKGGAK